MTKPAKNMGRTAEDFRQDFIRCLPSARQEQSGIAGDQKGKQCGLADTHAAPGWLLPFDDSSCKLANL